MWIEVLLLGIGVVVLLFLNIYYVLAPRNLFVTIVNESQCKARMKAGKFVDFLMPREGCGFDKNWNIVSCPNKRKRALGGLYWIGIPPFWEIYKYKFSWTGIDVNGEVVSHRHEILDYVLIVDDVYWASIDKAEDKNLVPLDIEILVTMRVINPYKALFHVQDWSEMVMNRIKPLIREYVSAFEFEEIVKKKQEKGGEIYGKLKGTGLIEEFKNSYGIKIKDGGIEIKSIDPSTIPGVPNLREVSLRKQIAEKDRERILVEADAERQRVLTLANAEEQRIKTVYGAVREMGEIGKLLRTLEMLEKSTGAGSRWVILPGGITEMISQILPGRTIDGPPAPDGGVWIKGEELSSLRNEISYLESLAGQVERRGLK